MATYNVKEMGMQPIEHLAFVLSKSISNTMDVEARLQEVQLCMSNFKDWVRSVLGDDFEELSISVTLNDNYKDQLADVFEELRTSFENVQCNIEELQDIDSAIFIAPKIKNRLNPRPNGQYGGNGDRRGLPTFLSVPAPVDDESSELYNQFLEEYMQATQTMSAYLLLIQQKTKKKRGDFIVYDEENTAEQEERRAEKLSHFNDERTDEQLKVMLKELIKLNYIAADTSESDFIYYLSGRGCKPKDCLRWNSADGMGVVLAVFINYFYGEESKKWKKGELIFGKKHLGQSYTQSLDNATYSSHFDKMKEIERKMR